MAERYTFQMTDGGAMAGRFIEAAHVVERNGAWLIQVHESPASKGEETMIGVGTDCARGIRRAKELAVEMAGECGWHGPFDWTWENDWHWVLWAPEQNEEDD